MYIASTISVGTKYSISAVQLWVPRPRAVEGFVHDVGTRIERLVLLEVPGPNPSVLHSQPVSTERSRPLVH